MSGGCLKISSAQSIFIVTLIGIFVVITKVNANGNTKPYHPQQQEHDDQQRQRQQIYSYSQQLSAVAAVVRNADGGDDDGDGVGVGDGVAGVGGSDDKTIAIKEQRTLKPNGWPKAMATTTTTVAAATTTALPKSVHKIDAHRSWWPSPSPSSSSSYTSMAMAMMRMLLPLTSDGENAIRNTPSNFNKTPLHHHLQQQQQQQRDKQKPELLLQRDHVEATEKQSTLVYADATIHLEERQSASSSPSPAAPSSATLTASGHVDTVNAGHAVGAVAADTSIGDGNAASAAAAVAASESEKLNKNNDSDEGEGVGNGVRGGGRGGDDVDSRNKQETNVATPTPTRTTIAGGNAVASKRTTPAIMSDVVGIGDGDAGRGDSGDAGGVVVGVAAAAAAGAGAAAGALSHRNGFCDKINISNQRNEFYGQRTKTTTIQTPTTTALQRNQQHQQQQQDQQQQENETPSMLMLRPMATNTKTMATKLKRAVNGSNTPTPTNAPNINSNDNMRTIQQRQVQRDGKSATVKDEPHFMPTTDKREHRHQQQQHKRQLNATPTTNTKEEPQSGQHELLVLHRRKRYLLFPESSSFQMIFDLIIPIVDWTNFAIMGITCAVAWELPSKPPSEIIETLTDRLKDGTLGLSRRNDSVDADGNLAPLQYVDANTAYAPDAPQMARGWQRQQQQEQQSPQWNGNEYHKYNSYNNNNNNKNNKWTKYENQPHTPYHESWQVRPNEWMVRRRWRQREREQQPNGHTHVSNAHGPQQPPQQPPNFNANGRRKLLEAPPQHRVYAVYPMQRQRWTRQRRQVADVDVEHMEAVAARMERVHLREHLMTRQKLYDKIEKLYKTRGHNGTACVLRALCETSQRAKRPQHEQQQHQYQQPHQQQYYRQQQQKQHQQHHQRHHHHRHHHQAEPQSFITELLRAIFTLPIDEGEQHLPNNTSNNRTTRTTEHQHQHQQHQHQLMIEHIAPHYRQAHLHGQHAAAADGAAAATAAATANSRWARDLVDGGAAIDCAALYGGHCELSIWPSDGGEGDASARSS